MAEILTRIQLRNDTTENWQINQSTVLASGEVGIEFVTGGSAKIKIGDGINPWSALPYFGGSSTAFYEATLEEGEDDQEALARVTLGQLINQGDFAVVKSLISEGLYSYTAYIYDNSTWKALDGNYNAENVYFNKDLTITANIGVQTIDSSGSKTLSTKGKNVQQVFDMIVAQEKNPTVSQPSCSVSLTGAGSKEVGTQFTPAWSVGFNKGSYQYGPDTGVTVSSYNVTDTNGGSSDAQSGSFTMFTVEDSTNYKVSATVTYGDGQIPVTNLGNQYTSGQILSGSKSASSSAVTGYRAWFNYVGTNTDSVDGSWIRTNGNNKGASGYNSFSLSIPDGTKRVVVAIPSSKNMTLKSVIDVDGMGLDVKGNFGSPQTIQVEGLNGYTAVDYSVWIFTNTNGISSTTYNFTFGS